MKRLTDMTDYVLGVYNDMEERLMDIEDILGDEYDLDRLRELVTQDRLGWLSPICIGCPGKTEDGKRTELCGEPDDLERCVEQSKRLAELAQAALRREQE